MIKKNLVKTAYKKNIYIDKLKKKKEYVKYRGEGSLWIWEPTKRHRNISITIFLHTRKSGRLQPYWFRLHTDYWLWKKKNHGELWGPVVGYGVLLSLCTDSVLSLFQHEQDSIRQRWATIVYDDEHQTGARREYFLGRLSTVFMTWDLTAINLWDCDLKCVTLKWWISQLFHEKLLPLWW